MRDFRSELYRRYVSKFKSAQLDRDDDALAAYHAWCAFVYRPLLAPIDRTAPVLELGCGPGDMLEYLDKLGFRSVEGIDISAEQVELAAARGLNARVADVFEHLEARENVYGAILAIDFVEHFTKDELLRLAAMFHRALRPGGTLILQTPNGAGLFPGQIVHGDLTHMTILTPDSMRQWLRTFDFEDLVFRETGPVPKDLVGAVRVALWKVLRFGAAVARKIETGKVQPVWTENMICRCVARKE